MFYIPCREVESHQVVREAYYDPVSTIADPYRQLSLPFESLSLPTTFHQHSTVDLGSSIVHCSMLWNHKEARISVGTLTQRLA